MSRAIKTWSDIIGHAAMLIILGVYAAFTLGFIGYTWYVGLGMLTSVMMAFHSWERKSYPMMVLNAVWFMLSLAGVLRPILMAVKSVIV